MGGNQLMSRRNVRGNERERDREMGQNVGRKSSKTKPRRQIRAETNIISKRINLASKETTQVLERGTLNELNNGIRKQMASPPPQFFFSSQ